MLIQLDVDGVLADFTGGCLRVMRGMGFHFDHADVTAWGIDDLLHEEQRPEFWRRVHLPGFCHKLEPLPGARVAVQRLRDAGHDVRFLTSAMPGHQTWREERTSWLITHLGMVDDAGPAIKQLAPDAITFAHDKHEHPGDVLVDDKPEHIQAWIETGRPAIMIDHPYNRARMSPAAGVLAVRAQGIEHAAELILARSW